MTHSTTSYDEIPYPLIAHSQTHPARMATLARLYGMTPAPVARCRVLEIGCAQGGNLIPIACEFSGSEFVGIDLSARQIADGQAFVRSLGLSNIRLEARDLLDFDESLGAFDYIIAHGLYSWVPQPVREKLFAVCQTHLTPNGLAYISFNAYPGWKAMGMVRDLMLYHSRQTDDPLAKAQAAQTAIEAMVQVLSEAAPSWDSARFAHAHAYKEIAERAQAYDLSYVVHEFLETINHPAYLHEFVEQAGRSGLQYLTEVNFRETLNANLPEPVVRLVEGFAGDQVEREQYLDFLANRSFHQALVCHAGVPVQFNLDHDTLRHFNIASPASLELESPPDQTAEQSIVGADGSRYPVEHPLAQTAWQCLIDLWPQSTTFDSLLAQAYEPLKATPPPGDRAQADAHALADHLIAAFLVSPRLVEFTVHATDFAQHVSERPVASGWARLQAERQTSITTLRHERYQLNTLERFVLQRLDGAHTVEQIVDQLLAGPFASGELELQEGETLTDPNELRAALGQAAGAVLHTFTLLPLLVG